MISKTEWDQIQERIKFNKVISKHSSPLNKPYWLRDMLECGLCGGKIVPHHGAKRKDGTFPRYYNCYWAGAGPGDLAHKEREKCRSPLIKARRLEAVVWADLTNHLIWDRQKKLPPLIDPEKYEKQIKKLKARKDRLKDERHKLAQKRDRLYNALEDGRFDNNELSRRLQKNKDEQLKINDRIKEAEQEVEDLKKTKEKDKLLQDWHTNKKDIIDKLAKKIRRMSPEDRKQLIEAIANGKRIKIEFYKEDWKETHWRPRWQTNTNDFVATLQHFMEEGKIIDLGKNSPDHFAGYHLWRLWLRKGQKSQNRSVESFLQPARKL